MTCASKTLAAIVSFALLALNDGARAQQSERSADTSPAWNDNSLITVQQKSGNPTRSIDVKIEFYGHDAFKVTSPDGLTVLTDPWRNDATGLYPKWFLSEFPAIPVDIVLSTHAHFDHDAVERPKGLMVLERLVGNFKLGDIQITGLADKHKCEPAPADKPNSASETCPPNNVIAFDNAIELIETGGLRIAIWGDNRATPDPFLDHYLKNVDVLILPVESVLTRAEVDAIVVGAFVSGSGTPQIPRLRSAGFPVARSPFDNHAPHPTYRVCQPDFIRVKQPLHGELHDLNFRHSLEQ
jgi:Beta-lactamase superfamily domain